MSTLKVDSITNDGSAVDFTYNTKVGNGTLKKEYYEQGTEPAYPCDGALWFNTSDDTFHIYANGGWYATTANQIIPLWYGSRGIFAGGYNGITGPEATIDYITIASTGNATDFGDLTLARNQSPASISDGTRGVFAGGRTSTSVNTIDYITVASTGNATDFGDLTVDRLQAAGASNSIKGLIIAGNSGAVSARTDVDKITIATAGNATSYSGVTSSAQSCTGWSNGDRAVFAIGYSGSAKVNTVEFLSFETEGNATDFGDLTVVRNNHRAAGNRTRMLVVGGDT